MTDHAEKRARFETKAPLKSEWVYRGKIISLRTDTLGSSMTTHQKWDIVVHPGAVAIVPVDNDGDLLLVKQWRRAIKEILIEIPAGTLEIDEPPLECAQRELREETGYEAKSLIPLGSFFSAPGFCTESLHLFIAEGLKSNPLPQDDDEDIDIVKVSLEQALAWIDDHTIRDAKSIAGILKYKRWLEASHGHHKQ